MAEEKPDCTFWCQFALSLVGREISVQGQPYLVREVLDNEPPSLVLEACIATTADIQADQYGRARRASLRITMLPLFEADGETPSTELMQIAQQLSAEQD